MSGESPQAKAAGEQAQWQAQLAQMLQGVAEPELKMLTGKIQGMLGSADATGRLAPDAAIRTSAMNELNRGYGQAALGSREAISYGGLRSGLGRMAPGAMNSAISSSATSLERDRQSALRNLEFMSAQSSLGDYNQLLQLLGQGTQTGLSLAGGYGGIAGQAISGMSTQAGGFFPGMMTGMSVGSSLGPYGAAIGGIAGGLIGAGSGT